MNADEIAEIREGYWGRPGSAREIRIRTLFAHIDLQAGQIATLKAALIEQIAQDKITQMGRFGFVFDSTVCDPYGDARKQLAREYPQIAWEEME
jgi:hypothetical protein